MNNTVIEGSPEVLIKEGPQVQSEQVVVKEPQPLEQGDVKVVDATLGEAPQMAEDGVTSTEGPVSPEGKDLGLEFYTNASQRILEIKEKIVQTQDPNEKAQLEQDLQKAQYDVFRNILFLHRNDKERGSNSLFKTFELLGSETTNLLLAEIEEFGVEYVTNLGESKFGLTCLAFSLDFAGIYETANLAQFVTELNKLPGETDSRTLLIQEFRMKRLPLIVMERMRELSNKFYSKYTEKGFPKNPEAFENLTRTQIAYLNYFKAVYFESNPIIPNIVNPQQSLLNTRKEYKQPEITFEGQGDLKKEDLGEISGLWDGVDADGNNTGGPIVNGVKMTWEQFAETRRNK